MRKTRKLDKAPAGPKPAYVMPAPNDDAAAFGWTLGKLRYPGKPEPGEKQEDAWPGSFVFQVSVPYEIRQVYGHNIQFICPEFAQLVLDGEPEIRAGAEKVKQAGYTPEALDKFRKTIQRVFREKVVPNVEHRFDEIAGMVAEFYAARLAHIDKFGVED
jgi:hypothetical protein